jgi:hypothetical protein
MIKGWSDFRWEKDIPAGYLIAKAAGRRLKTIMSKFSSTRPSEIHPGSSTARLLALGSIAR